MSKKIAAGADAIVLDVKVGKGAFMQTEADAALLARTMVEIGRGVGRRVSALIADMNQPLGTTVGNALEIMEAVAALTPERRFVHGGHTVIAGDDFVEHVTQVAAEMLQLVGVAENRVDAAVTVRAAVDDGRALAKFRAWVSAQGGDAGFLDGRASLPQAQYVVMVPASRDGHVAGLDALAVGLAAMQLGAGRAKKGDPIDLAVGIILHRKIGDHVASGDPLFTIHANDETRLRIARDAQMAAYAWSDSPVQAPVYAHRVIR